MAQRTRGGAPLPEAASHPRKLERDLTPVLGVKPTHTRSGQNRREER
jgi:hypothetical protein